MFPEEVFRERQELAEKIANAPVEYLQDNAAALMRIIWELQASLALELQVIHGIKRLNLADIEIASLCGSIQRLRGEPRLQPRVHPAAGSRTSFGGKSGPWRVAPAARNVLAHSMSCFSDSRMPTGNSPKKSSRS
jgi:hypothetical protein